MSEIVTEICRRCGQLMLKYFPEVLPKSEADRDLTGGGASAPKPSKKKIVFDDDALADRLADDHYRDDPFDVSFFDGVAPSLLSAADIKRYVLETGMLCPFYEDKLKTASYEIRPGSYFTYWEQRGARTKQVTVDIKPWTRSVVLPRNSISYIQVEPFFRLPLYIAMRFNLRITHVHRGLLLGTGPLVDPGFRGRLLIPIHNLTATDYELDLSRGSDEDGLIWAEFTKTTFNLARDESTEFPKRKKDKRPEYYLRKANAGNPILSSIHDAVEGAKDAATKARRAVYLLSGVGIIAIATIVVELLSLMNGISSRQTDVEREIGDLRLQIEQEKTRSSSAAVDRPESRPTPKLQQRDGAPKN